MSDQYDVLIVGGGQAGPRLAHDLAKASKRVALAERKYLGGSCVNFGCTPTKAAIASARVAHLARRGHPRSQRTTPVQLPSGVIRFGATQCCPAIIHLSSQIFFLFS
jgi:pyruvate/2-oxoglutarate dehydrogenase complex dihydrolipoamide dehydrogenase (E3) component